jgi:hypothetical protein
MSILREYSLGSALFGSSVRDIVYKPTATAYSTTPQTQELRATAVSASSGGWVVIILLDGEDNEPCVVETEIAVKAGDIVTVALAATKMRVTGKVGGGDRTDGEIQGAITAAVEAANVAADALAEAAMAQDKADAADAAALAASQAADEALTQAEWVKNQQEYDEIAITDAQQAAEDAALNAELALTALDEYQVSTAAAIEESADGILISVAAEYARQTDVDNLSASVQSQLAIRDDEISLSFQQATSATENVAGALAADQAERNSYYRFSGDAMEIGREESAFKTVIDNTHMGFVQDGTEIAAIYNNRMYVTTVEAKNTLTVGAPNLGLYDWYQKANGNLSLKYRGTTV